MTPCRIDANTKRPHIWHDEVVLWPPFRTAMQTADEIPVMLGEMATIGVGMAVLVTVVWLVMTLVVDYAAKHASSKIVAKEA